MQRRDRATALLQSLSNLAKVYFGIFKQAQGVGVRVRVGVDVLVGVIVGVLVSVFVGVGVAPVTARTSSLLL